MKDKEELIVKYIQGELTADELKKFELAMSTDPVLREEVNELNLLENHLRDRESINNSLTQLKNVHINFKESENSTGIIPNNLWRRFFILGLTLISLLIAYYLFQKENKAEDIDESLYANYFNPDQANFQTKGSETDLSLQRAQLLFNNKDYVNSSIEFKNFINNSTTATSDIQFYYALSLIGSDQIDKARKLLMSIGEANPSFRNETRYYVAISYLKESNKPQAVNWLQQIEINSSKYSISQELLSKI